jgi:geranylgeranylglycerol-phosphate geranylgeranyltransferase
MVTRIDSQEVPNNNNTQRILTITQLGRQSMYLIGIFVHYVKARTAPVYCFPIATFISFLLISKADILEHGFAALGICIASYFLSLATYVYNDLTDIKVDMINRKEQSIITQNQSKLGLIFLVVFLFGLSISISYVVSYYTLFISMIFIVLGISYSHPKFNLKNRFPLKTVVTATGAGLLSLLGAVAAIVSGSNYIPSFNTPVLPFSVVYLAFSYSMFYFIQSPMGDIADIKGDAAAGRKTFPLVLGMNGTLAVMLSVPFTMLIMNALCYDLVHISVHGTVAIVATCILVVGFIGRISNKFDKPLFIKSKRNQVRLLNILMQVALLIALI